MTPEERLDRAEKLIIQLRNKIPFGDWVKYGFTDDLNKIVGDLIAVHGNDPEVVEDKPTEPVKESGEYLPPIITPAKFNTSGYVTAHSEEEFFDFAIKAISYYCKKHEDCECCPLEHICNHELPCDWCDADVTDEWKKEFDRMKLPPSGITVNWTPTALPNLKEIERLLWNGTITTDTDWRKF